MPWPNKKIAKSVDKMLKKKDIAKLNEQFSTFHNFYVEWKNAEADDKGLAAARVFQELDALLQKDDNWKKFSDQLEGFLNGPKDNSEAAVCKWTEENYWAYRFLASNDVYEFCNNYDFIGELNGDRNPFYGYIRMARTFFSAYANDKDIWGSNRHSMPSEENYKKWQESNFEKGRDGGKPDQADIRQWKRVLAGNFEPVKDPEAAKEFEKEFAGFVRSHKPYREKEVDSYDHTTINDDIWEERRTFYNEYKGELDVELGILSEGPKGADHLSMFEWVSKLPAIIARRDTIGYILSDRNNPLTPQQEQLVDLAKTWYEVFLDRQARHLISGGSYNSKSDIISEKTKAAIPQIEIKFNDWVKAKENAGKEVEAEKDAESVDEELEAQSNAPNTDPSADIPAILDVLEKAKDAMDQSAVSAQQAADIFMKAVEASKDGFATRLHLQIKSDLATIYAIARQESFGKEFADIVDEKLKAITVKEFETNKDYSSQLKIRPEKGEKAPEPQHYYLKDRNMFELAAAGGKLQALKNIVKNNKPVLTDPAAPEIFKDMLLEALEKGGIFLGRNAPKIADYYYAAESLFGSDIKKQIDDAIAANGDLSRTILYCQASEVRSLSRFSRKKDPAAAEELFRNHMVKAFKDLMKYKDEIESNDLIGSAVTDLVTSYAGYGKQIPEVDAIVKQNPRICKSVINNLLNILENGYDKRNMNAARAAACVRKIQALDPDAVLDESAKIQLEENVRNFSARFGKKFTVPMEDPVDYFKEDFAKLNDHIKELVNAKTTFNSGEYKNIINTVRQLNEQEAGPWGAEGAKLPRKQNHAAKLLTIKKMINEYIQHKADDGVKKNTYHKLAAVESLNKFVTERLKELKPESFTGDNLKKLNGTLANLDKDIKHHFGKDEVEPYVAKANMAGAAATSVAECVNCLDCMQRIIEKADDPKSAATAGQVNELRKMQKQFNDYPGEAEVSEYKTKGYLLHENVAFQDVEKSLADAANMLTIENYSLKYSLQRSGMSYGEKEQFMLLFDKITDTEMFGRRIRYMQQCAEEADAAAVMLDQNRSEEDRKAQQGRIDSLDKAVADSMKAISQNAKNRLPGFVDNIFSNINTDKDLVQEWPKLHLAVNCYRSVFGKPHEKQALFEKYEQQMKAVQKTAEHEKVKAGENKMESGLQNAK